MIYWLASQLLTGLYFVLPVASLVAFFVRVPPRLHRNIAGGWISGTIMGGALLAAYAFSIGGRVSVAQIALALYLGVALLLLLKLADYLVHEGIRRAFRVEPGSRRWRRFAASLVRVIVFGSLALPWVMAAVMVYRPRLEPVETPGTVLNIEYEDVTFPAADDSTRIGGWYVPAAGDLNSGTTALLCHGVGSSKAGFFQLLKLLHENEINVLLIDHRAHGRSAGQRCSFGALETRDVRGAIEWLKSNRPDNAGRIIGVGASMGAAALLRAGADDLRLDGVVVLGGFDSMVQLRDDISQRQLVPPINWLARIFGLPMASLHAGVDLSAVRPADAIGKVWPRPVLVVHGTEDEIIPFEHGQRLFRAAYEPRQSLWIQGGSHNGILESPAVQGAIIEFIQTAEEVPLI